MLERGEEIVKVRERRLRAGHFARTSEACLRPSWRSAARHSPSRPFEQQHLVAVLHPQDVEQIVGLGPVERDLRAGGKAVFDMEALHAEFVTGHDGVFRDA